MTWSNFHRRGDVLRAVVAAAEARRDGVLPSDVAGVDAVFDDERDLLGALQLSWYTRLMGRIDRHQMQQPSSLENAVVAAWHQTYTDLGGVRLVLDEARESTSQRVSQAMVRATVKEHTALAVAAGLGNPNDAASARVGARIERRARETHVGGGSEAATTSRVFSIAVWDRMVERLRSLAA